MATADAFRSSTTRGVTLRRRGDLVVNRQVYQGQAWWVVKDPISLHYLSVGREGCVVSSLQLC